MGEEEKEAIWYCSEILADNKNDIEHWKIVENLIDRLKKENEELKEENFDQVYMKAIADYKEKIRAKIKELKEEESKIKNKGTLIIDEEKGTISHEGIEGMNDVINLVVTRKEIAFFEKILNEEIK